MSKKNYQKIYFSYKLKEILSTATQAPNVFVISLTLTVN